ncbi:DUF3887 domain-containing protein [Megamonas funiformis]|uniref:DUF3887 domain-containing protein n=1 Tax=Megamonas funiformis TaxID=437897 RepID=UPI0014300515|nr:DUF3887 domain-containing protein [Megamonas funiformis]NJE29016.1 DUF3887 domain-containing protein [Megamonas funiformis]
MKKIVLIFLAVMMMAFSSVCMAADGGDLNKDQKVAETFISGITTEKVVYDKFVANFDNGLKSKIDAKAYDALKNDVKTKFGDFKESKFYSFERYDNQDKVTYIASFSKEEIIAMVFVFDKNNKLVEFGLLPIQQNQQTQESAQQ